MRQVVIVRAEMTDGAVIEETATEFGHFVDMVLGFRRDAECARVTWAEEEGPPDPLAPLARRCAQVPGYVAHALSGTDPALVREQLGCDRATLSRLAVCRTPRPERWDEDLRTIAAYATIAPERLALVLGGER